MPFEMPISFMGSAWDRVTNPDALPADAHPGGSRGWYRFFREMLAVQVHLGSMRLVEWVLAIRKVKH